MNSSFIFFVSILLWSSTPVADADQHEEKVQKEKDQKEQEAWGRHELENKRNDEVSELELVKEDYRFSSKKSLNNHKVLKSCDVRKSSTVCRTHTFILSALAIVFSSSFLTILALSICTIFSLIYSYH